MSKIAAASVIILLLLLGVLLTAPGPAHAQVSPTPTPGSYSTTLPLSDGNSVLLERRFTFGDMAVVFMLLLLALIVVAESVTGFARKVR